MMARSRSDGESAPMTLDQALAAKVSYGARAADAEPDCRRAGVSPRRRDDRHRLGGSAVVPALRIAGGGFRRQRRDTLSQRVSCSLLWSASHCSGWRPKESSERGPTPVSAASAECVGLSALAMEVRFTFSPPTLFRTWGVRSTVVITQLIQMR